MRFSVVIPARNEEARLGACLDSVRAAGRIFSGDMETVVVLNRCTDGTEAIARDRGARIVREDAKCLSTIRNAGARAARGEILVTLDADSRMTRNLLMEIDAALASGRYVGGGVDIWPDRISLGIALTGLAVLVPVALVHRISCGCFWVGMENFRAVGGFDETVFSAEDIDFARRLKAFGRKKGLAYGTLHRGFIRTSTRKFDRLGDWHVFREPRLYLSLLRGRNRPGADRYWYDFER